MEATSQLNVFEEQHDQINKSHDDLVAMGRGIAAKIETSDSSMFGPSDSAHPASTKVEGVVSGMVECRDKMEGVVTSRLQQLQMCRDFHSLKKTLNTVSCLVSIHTYSHALMHSDLWTLLHADLWTGAL